MTEFWSGETSSEDETYALAAALAKELLPGDVLALDGPLGVGKTTFARGICEALGVPREAGFSSPTYALVNLNEGGRHPVAHCDLYRLDSADDLEGLGFRDLLEGPWVVLVEWPERVPEVLADATVRISITDRGPEKRAFRVSATVPGRWKKSGLQPTTAD